MTEWMLCCLYNEADSGAAGDGGGSGASIGAGWLYCEHGCGGRICVQCGEGWWLCHWMVSKVDAGGGPCRAGFVVIDVNGELKPDHE